MIAFARAALRWIVPIALAGASVSGGAPTRPARAGLGGHIGGEPWKGWTALAQPALDGFRRVDVYSAPGWTCVDVAEWGEGAAVGHGISFMVPWRDGLETSAVEGRFDGIRPVVSGHLRLSLEAPRIVLAVRAVGESSRADFVLGEIDVVDCAAP